jgi:hypothetical protein
MRRLSCIFAVLAAIGCSRPSPSSEPASASAPALPDAGSVEVDGGSAAFPDAGHTETGPRVLPVSLASALGATGEVALVPQVPSVIDPAAAFRVEIGARLEDARLILLDEQEALVATQGSVELGPVTRFTLRPDQPLRPGTSYTLRVDGASIREIHGESGPYAPVSFQLKTTGERPPPASSGQKSRKHRHRR